MYSTLHCYCQDPNPGEDWCLTKYLKQTVILKLNLEITMELELNREQGTK